MKRLPNNFKPVLDEVKSIFVYENNMSFSDINNKYNRINKIFKKNECEPYDVNNMLDKYSIDGCYADIVKDMRKLTQKRNKEILTKVYKSSKWNKFIKDIKNDLKNEYKVYVKTVDIRDGLLHVLKKYKDNWLGFWSIIDISENGRINKFKLFDIDDQSELKRYLRKRKYKI